MKNYPPPRTHGRVLIAAFSNWEGLSRAPYLFRRAGCQVDVYTPPDTFLANSSWVGQHHVGASDLDTFVEQLRQLVTLRGEDYRWILIGDDPLLCELGRRRDESWARALLPCRQDDADIDFLVSKIAFITRCEQAGIPVPPYRICNNHQDIQAATAELGLPIVLKAPEGFGGLTMTVIDSTEQIPTVDCSGPTIAQAFVRGPVCSAAAVYQHGRLTGFYAYRRARTWGSYGSSTAVSFEPFPGLRAILEQLGELSGFHGLCGIDFIREEATGQLRILEQNFRPTLTMLLGRRAGADLAPCLGRAFRNDTPPGEPLTQAADFRATVPMFPADVLRALSANDARGLLRWCLFPTYWRELPWHDWQSMRRALRTIGREMLRKLDRALTLLNTGQQRSLRPEFEVSRLGETLRQSTVSHKSTQLAP